MRRDWLRGDREAAVRFVETLLLAYDALQKDPTVGIRALAVEAGISQAWAETIYRVAPPPKITEWANIRYRYSLVNGSVFQRRLGYLAAFLYSEKVIARPVDVRDVLDATVITEALQASKRAQ